ncbi:MAG: ATP-dependent DNA helicase RecG, partial [Deltaproteobacteria bacterium]
MTPENTDTQGIEDKAGRLMRAMTSILKPLDFASKDSFAHMNSVKGLERLVGRVCADLPVIGLPGGVIAGIGALKALLSGFDGLDAGVRKERIASAIDIVNSIIRTPIERAYSIPEEELAKRLRAIKTPLKYVKGIGPKLALRLEKKGLKTVEDVLYFLPIRYEDRRSLKKISELSPGLSHNVVAEVLAAGEVRYGRRKVFEAALGDGTGMLKARWFNYRTTYMKERFKVGRKLRLFGAVSAFGGQKEMIHPDVEPCDMEASEDEQDFQGIVPVYSQIENFHQKTVRKMVKGVVEAYAGFALPGVPGDVLRRHALPDINTAFIEAHMPSGSDVLTPAAAKKGLVFDELFLLELGMLLKKRAVKKERGIGFSFDGVLEGGFKRLLPFKLTGAQERALDEIKKDMAAPHPMNRLVQGDVGSGKTVVAFIAALNAIEGGYQAAIMAPTEILAEQHSLSIHRYAALLGINPVLLTGGMAGPSKRKAADDIRSGNADLVIGTHALIQKDVEFKRLGLAVIDEQHRFGVAQRAALKKKAAAPDIDGGVCPDILIMTATPIPRTLSMTVFGDLDVSVIDELPPGRQPVLTRVMREKERERAYGLIRGELESGRQCYIVYPLVEESEELSLKDATNMKEHLRRDVFADFNVGLLHGRMKPAQKESVMRDFKDGKFDILVSTTVIEVGVDVPNATVILIEHAERFGLAQLHQLRGRVGRGDKKSICLLLAAWTNSEDTYRRLKVLEETMDGFRIAEEDLKIRGPGDFLGTRQAGLPDFRLTEALSDLTIIKKAREEAFRLLERNPEAAESVYLREVLKSRWEGRF